MRELLDAMEMLTVTVGNDNRTLNLKEQVNGYLVSTVSLPFRHDGGIFETMVFPEGSWLDIECRRYETAADAEAGHAAMVITVKDWPHASTRAAEGD